MIIWIWIKSKIGTPFQLKHKIQQEEVFSNRSRRVMERQKGQEILWASHILKVTLKMCFCYSRIKLTFSRSKFTLWNKWANLSINIGTKKILANKSCWPHLEWKKTLCLEVQLKIKSWFWKNQFLTMKLIRRKIRGLNRQIWKPAFSQTITASTQIGNIMHHIRKIIKLSQHKIMKSVTFYYQI